GGCVIQAHPFRHGMVVTNANAVDAVEIFNGHPGHNSNNDIAEAWARKYGKIMTSGTDHHNPDHMPDAGIRTDFPITSEAVLIETLKSGAFTLIRGEEDAKN
ncbi:MAG: PHP domain-containing protein, partial [Clostridia bacterium]|nr:PHP domain-containing protein [Clostridia bacterium]